MGFDIRVVQDERRDVETWCIAETDALYQQYGSLLEDAHTRVMDMFISPKPFLFFRLSPEDFPAHGEISRGVFVINPSAVTVERGIFLVNTMFWQQCGSEMSVYQMIMQLGELVFDDDARAEVLTEWQAKVGLSCFGVRV